MVPRKARAKARTSIGSPSGVAVPWASTKVTSSGGVPAMASAIATTSACPVTEGAVKPALAEPSLLSAAPRTTARMASPSASASSRRLRTTTPAPLPGTVPRAAASNGRQRPSGERMPPS